MKKQYHHGNLKVALVEHAIKLLEKEGLSALSLRRVAKLAGVSQAAPYSHFQDKKTLLAAVASEGYKRFSVRIQSEAEQDSSDYAIGLGRGYVLFALENPALFHLMFGGELAELVDINALDDSAHDSFQLLVNSVAERPISKITGPQGHKLDTAVAWSLVHGLANLLLDKKLRAEDYGFKDTKTFVDYVLQGSLG